MRSSACLGQGSSEGGQDGGYSGWVRSSACLGQGSSEGGQDGGYSRFARNTATVAATAAAAATLLYSDDRYISRTYCIILRF